MAKKGVGVGEFGRSSRTLASLLLHQALTGPLQSLILCTHCLSDDLVKYFSLETKSNRRIMFVKQDS